MTGSNGERKVLITGGAGFIGSHLALHLQQRGDHLTIIDDFSTGRRENLQRLDATRFDLIESTVSAALVDMPGGRFDEVYHLAAAVGVRLVIERPIHTIETNIRETDAVLAYCLEGSTPVLIASSSEVYGKSEKSPFSEDDDVTYGPTTFSRWSYAASKAIDEYLALAFHKEHDLPTCVVRFFNTIGPGQIGTYGMVLPRFVEAALTGRTLEVHGDGSQVRCFCDVRDVVTALPMLLSAPELAGRVYNIGSDRPISIAELARLVCKTIDSSSKVEFVPYERAFGAGFDDLKRRVPDLTRIRTAIGFEPVISLEQTILDIAATIQSPETSQLEAGA